MATLPLTIPKGRIKCPWMAIPIPGERPFIVATENMLCAVRGTTVTDAALTTIQHPRHGEIRALEITHRPSKFSRVHGRTVLYDRCHSRTDQMILRTSIRQWAEKQRESRAQKVVGNGSARARQIAIQIRRLEKEKSRVYGLHRPVHPLIPNRRTVGNDSYYRELFANWHAEKPIRKNLGAIAAQVIKSRITSTTAYTRLRSELYTFKKYSEMTENQREHKKIYSQNDYWKWLFRSVSGVEAKKPGESLKDMDRHRREHLERHAEYRREHLAAKRQVESLDAQIQSLRELAQN